MTTPPNTQEPALADCTETPNPCDVMEEAWARNKARQESPIMARDITPIWSREPFRRKGSGS